MATIRARGVVFRIYPQDHDPIHAHARYGDTVVVVELTPNRMVVLADRPDASFMRKAKRSDVRKILRVAAEQFDAIMAAWEEMQ